ncbi:MAG: GNAT family N-acetyltransferase [Thermoplasmata archaeon]|nr:GNAT family N-acetyltransferase [Thermoplasmata archaeon]
MLVEPLLRPAREVPAFTLVELTAHMRRLLAERGEPLAPAWPEIAAERLRTGELDGWVAEEAGRPVALVLFSRREHRAYGHLHVEAKEARVPLSRRLTLHALHHMDPAILRADLGTTGLSEVEDRELGGALTQTPGFEVVERHGLLRTLQLDEPPRTPELPPGYEFLPISAAPLDALDALDRRAFRGGADESLVADSPEGNRRVLERILSGELGRFLPEASAAVARGEELVAFLLTTEESARAGVFADLAVDPAHRRRGIAGALLQQGLRALLALGYGSARLWVTASNTPARELYRRVGFERERTAFIFRWRKPR